MSLLDRLARAVGFKSPQQLKRPDAEFMGDALVHTFLFHRFRLTNNDFSRLTANLPSELKEPAKIWIVIYGTWLFQVALRTKYGNEFVEQALSAARRRLERKVEGSGGTAFIRALDFWFARLDDAVHNQDYAKVQGVELPFELFATWSFLTLDPKSPLFGRTNIPGQLDFTVADCLMQGKTEILKFVRFAVEIGGPLPIALRNIPVVSPVEFAEWRRVSPNTEGSFERLLRSLNGHEDEG